MLPGTIIMLILIVVVIYGGAGWLMKLNLKGERQKKLQVSDPTNGDS